MPVSVSTICATNVRSHFEGNTFFAKVTEIMKKTRKLRVVYVIIVYVIVIIIVRRLNYYSLILSY